MSCISLDVVSKQCIEIIEEIRHSGYFVTYEQVVCVLLDRYSIPSLNYIGIGDPINVPVLNWLLNIQNKFRVFLKLWISTSNIMSSFKTIADLDLESYDFLKSFSFPNLNSFIEKRKVVVDANEIDIDNDETLSAPSASNNLSHSADKLNGDLLSFSLEWFGLGKISDEPTVRLYFHLPYNKSYDTSNNQKSQNRYTVTSKDIYHHFLKYLTNASAQVNGVYSTSQRSLINIEQFCLYILSVYKINQLNEIGVFFTGDFEVEKLTLSHIINKYNLRLIEVQKKELQGFQSKYDMNNYECSSSASQHFRNTISSSVATSSSSLINLPLTMKMKNPSNVNIQHLLEEVTQLLSERRNGSLFSPSSKQIYDVLIEDIIGMNNNNNNNNNKLKRKKRKNKMIFNDAAFDSFHAEYFPNNNNSNSAPQTDDDMAISESVAVTAVHTTRLLHILEVVTEYLMLHLGGRKHFAKRIECDVTNTNTNTNMSELSNTNTNTNETSESTVSDENALYDTSKTPISVSDQCIATTSVETITDKVNEEKSYLHLNNAESNVTTTYVESLPASLTDDSKVKTFSNIYESSLKTADSILTKIPLETTSSPRFESRMHSKNSSSSLLLNTLNNLENNIYYINTHELKNLHGYMSSSSTTTAIHHDLPPPSSGMNMAMTSGKISCVDDLRWVGRWGEELVYQYLVCKSISDNQYQPYKNKIDISSDYHTSLSMNKTQTTSTVEWLNEHSETKSPYDIIVTTKLSDGRSRRQYIEVKSTRFPDNNVFEISLDEWQFAVNLPRVEYAIYRVYNVGDMNKVKICVVSDVYTFVSQKQVKLCLAI